MARGTFSLAIAIAGLLPAQPPPPGQDPPAIERRIGDIRRQLERSSPADPEEKELAGFVQRYLDAAANALKAGKRFQAQRLADAADACRRPIEHLQRVAALQHAPAPPHPGPPGNPEDRLRELYFRLRLSDFFLQQIPPPAPARLLALAREFYERAVKARQQGKQEIADENARASDDLTHALESLAQAAVP